MAEKQHDFIGHDDIPADAIERMSAPEVMGAWEGRLQEMFSVVEHALGQLPETNERRAEIARWVTLTLCDTLGGTIIYLPRGDALKRAIRDTEIYRDWQKSGKLPRQLARKYKLGEQAVYAIIAKQRELHRRLEPDLFGFDE